MYVIREKMETSLDNIDANNEMFKVLQGTLVSRMDIHQTRIESTEEEINTKMDIHKEMMETAIHSIRSELEETIRYQIEDILSFCRPRNEGPPQGTDRED
jgi:hypothetical protein